MHKPHDLVITQAWLPRYQRRIFTLSLCALTKSSKAWRFQRLPRRQQSNSKELPKAHRGVRQW